MKKIDFFAPYCYIDNFDLQDEMYKRYVNKIINHYKWKKRLIPFGWQGKLNTAFSEDKPPKLPNIRNVNWNMLQNAYSDKISQFIQSNDLQVSGFYIDNIWINCYGMDDFQEIHSHNQYGHLFSAVHFLKYDPSIHEPLMFVNESEQYSKFTSKSDVDNLRKSSGNSYYRQRFSPEIDQGDFLIFPSGLPHFVPRQKTKEPRITVSMNMRLMFRRTDESNDCIECEDY